MKEEEMCLFISRGWVLGLFRKVNSFSICSWKKEITQTKKKRKVRQQKNGNWSQRAVEMPTKLYNGPHIKARFNQNWKLTFVNYDYDVWYYYWLRYTVLEILITNPNNWLIYLPHTNFRSLLCFLLYFAAASLLSSSGQSIQVPSGYL